MFISWDNPATTPYDEKKKYKDGLVEAGKKKAKETFSKLKAKRKSKKRAR